MINKVIHYCWFGGKEMPQSAQKCIESWKKYCPDYKIVLWNEKNFNLEENDYIKEAFENKKWAFITDYVRLKVLYTEGGIYMDTDVELIDGLDSFLEYSGFSGFENEREVPTGIMASEKGNQFIKILLDYYQDKHFIDENGNIDLTTNVEVITNFAVQNGLKLDNTFQKVLDYYFFPRDYFCPKDSRTLRVHKTKNTVCIHHFAGSWLPKKNRFKNFIKLILGEKLSLYISKKKNKK